MVIVQMRAQENKNGSGEQGNRILKKEAQERQEDHPDPNIRVSCSDHIGTPVCINVLLF